MSCASLHFGKYIILITQERKVITINCSRTFMVIFKTFTFVLSSVIYGFIDLKRVKRYLIFFVRRMRRTVLIFCIFVFLIVYFGTRACKSELNRLNKLYVRLSFANRCIHIAMWFQLREYMTHLYAKILWWRHHNQTMFRTLPQIIVDE